MTQGKQQQQKKEAKAAPLPVMLGRGEDFYVDNKKYTVKPLSLKAVQEFSEDNLNVGPQLFNMIDDEGKKKVDKWLNKQVIDANGEPMSLDRAVEEDWDLSHLRECIHRMIDISG